jgi:hypothetical protein
MILRENLVLLGVLNLRGGNSLSTQAFSHSCLPFLDFLIQVIVFYKPTRASFTFTCLSPIETLSSFINYWHVLENT